MWDVGCGMWDVVPYSYRDRIWSLGETDGGVNASDCTDHHKYRSMFFQECWSVYLLRILAKLFKMNKILLTLVLLPLIFNSCRKEESAVNVGNDKLIGTWINPRYSDSLITYDRAESMVQNEPGIVFRQDSTLTERKNNGWCGTPPIVTSDYEGSWAMKDSLLYITVKYWGGTADYTWRMQSLSSQKLVFSIVNQQYHEQGKK